MIHVRPATAADVPVIVDLLEDIERYYGNNAVLPDRASREQQAIALLFRPSPAAHVLLAVTDGHTAGLASYSLLWPAEGVTASLYLKELYIRDGYRRHGIGTRLLKHICAIAADNGYSRVEWTTDKNNPTADTFYAQLGAATNPDKTLYRVDGNTLTRLAQH
ncbi:N-acetyltransferase GCN5 [Mangrovihabitans endophyticus]|uniref:N-acetyltransferase GCN5 n=2 Tax=Mangrovihabitans endophyticus TaxID=1751298 RepID=A0A8J3C509_9ACTN|nr:N-acetyltransferase GCN5 [Mangrovihabitans endophyticus]